MRSARCACSRRSASSACEKRTRFYQASTSELYGLVQETPQKETTPFYPRSPYGVAKLYAYWITVNYREAYGMYACNGILFNHESPVRGETFVTRKITRGAGAHQARPAGLPLSRQPRRQARLGPCARLRRGAVADAAAGRAGGFRHRHRASSTACAISSRSRPRRARHADSTGRGKGVEEKGFDASAASCIVAVDPRYFRPAEVETLLGDATKAREKLGWQPRPASTSWSRDGARRFSGGVERAAAARTREGQVMASERSIPWAKPVFWGNEERYVREALTSSWISGGHFVDRLESGFAKYNGIAHAIATSNGTTALHLAYLALGIGAGDEIIVPGFAFMAAANVAMHVGATPVFADIDPRTWCLTAAEVERRLSPKTKAIVPVHTYATSAPSTRSWTLPRAAAFR